MKYQTLRRTEGGLGYFETLNSSSSPSLPLLQPNPEDFVCLTYSQIADYILLGKTEGSGTTSINPDLNFMSSDMENTFFRRDQTHLEITKPVFLSLV